MIIASQQISFSTLHFILKYFHESPKVFMLNKEFARGLIMSFNTAQDGGTMGFLGIKYPQTITPCLNLMSVL